MDALEPFTCPAPAQDPEVLPYMREAARSTYSVDVTADIVPAGVGAPCRVSNTNFSLM
jgi:hypothetical protein